MVRVTHGLLRVVLAHMRCWVVLTKAAEVIKRASAREGETGK